MLCFRKSPVASKFMDKRGVGEYQDFPSKSFCLKVPKKIVGELLCAAFQKKSGSKKVYRQERGGSTMSSFENCLSHSAAIFVGQPFSVSLISGIEKLYA